jgi:hypothetical protein
MKFFRCEEKDRERVEEIAKAVDVYLDAEGQLYFVPKAAEIENNINLFYNNNKGTFWETN